MLKDIGIHSSGGDMDPADRERAQSLIKALESKIETKSANVVRRAIRPLLLGSLYVGLHEHTFFVGYQPHLGMPTIFFSNLTATGSPTLHAYYVFLYNQLGFDDPCIFTLDRSLSDLPAEAQDAALDRIASQIIASELTIHQRKQQDREISRNPMHGFSPIFGPNRFPIQEKLVFVLMPFQDALTQIYQKVIKPTVESDFGMVCRRADEISSNRAIMDDIWKSICEARLVIADLTGFNPNVMYELGITHTVGKETILVYQRERRASVKFPFDLSHIRRVEYEDTVVGGDKLRADLQATLKACLNPNVAGSTQLE
jgi:hypothetical protein